LARIKYTNESEMFDRIHEMRKRIITSRAFNGDRVIGAILFEGTMDRDVDGRGTAEYLWEREAGGSVPEGGQGAGSRVRRRPAHEADFRSRRAARAGA
jgi:hypothetical protein